MKRPYNIDKKLLRGLIGRAVSAGSRGGQEVCGLLVRSGSQIHPVELRNKSKNPGSFCFYAPEVKTVKRAARKLQMEIVGTFHSHPSSSEKPGKSDIDGTLDDALMLVIDCTRKSAGLWHVRNGKATQLKYCEA